MLKGNKNVLFRFNKKNIIEKLEKLYINKVTNTSDEDNKLIETFK